VTTLKIKIEHDSDLLPLLREGNKVVRIAFNLFKYGLNLTQVQQEIQKKYQINSILDTSLIKFSCQEAEIIYKSYKERKQKTIIFGSKSAWQKFNRGKITKDQWNIHRNNRPILFVGSKSDNNGNRKVKLDINNKQIILKLNKSNHIPLKLHTSEKRFQTLSKLEDLASNHLIPITYKLSNDFIYVTYDEGCLAQKHEFVKERVASLDLNPNYIALVIKDYYDNSVVYKQIFDLTNLNKLDNNDKITYEVLQISHSIAKTVKHYKCEIVGLEDLSIRSKNHLKGKGLNRLINNKWKRNLFVNNLVKNLNILGINNQKIMAAYSSTIGCIQNPDETDSIAAALEIGRRCFVFKKRFLDKEKEFLDMDVIYPCFNYDQLKERWNSILLGYNVKHKGWKSIHEYLKKQKKLIQLRFLFKDYDFSQWSCYRFKSIKSSVTTNLYI
jgi:hypothetical protein